MGVATPAERAEQRTLTRHGFEGKFGFYYSSCSFSVSPAFELWLKKYGIVFSPPVANCETRRDDAEDSVSGFSGGHRQIIRSWEARRYMAEDDVSNSSGGRLPLSGIGETGRVLSAKADSYSDSNGESYPYYRDNSNE